MMVTIGTADGDERLLADVVKGLFEFEERGADPEYPVKAPARGT